MPVTYASLTQAQKEFSLGCGYCAEHAGGRTSGQYDNNNGTITFNINWQYGSTNYDGRDLLAVGDAIGLGIVTWTGDAAAQYCDYVATHYPTYWALWPASIRSWLDQWRGGTLDWWTVQLSESQNEQLQQLFGTNAQDNIDSQTDFYMNGSGSESLPSFCAAVEAIGPLDDVKAYIYLIMCYLWAPLFAQDVYAYCPGQSSTLAQMRDAAIAAYNAGWSGHYYDAGMRNRLNHYSYDCLEDWNTTTQPGTDQAGGSWAGGSDGIVQRQIERVVPVGNQLLLRWTDGTVLFLHECNSAWIPNQHQAADAGGVPYLTSIIGVGSQLLTLWSDTSTVALYPVGHAWIPQRRKDSGSGQTSGGITIPQPTTGLPGINDIYNFCRNNINRYSYAFDVYGNYPSGTGVRPLGINSTNYLDCSWFVSMMVANFSPDAWNNAGFSTEGYAPDCSGLWYNTQELWTRPYSVPDGILPGDIFLMAGNADGITGGGRHVMMLMPDGYFWDVALGWSGGRAGGPNYISGGIVNSFEAVLAYYISGLYNYWCISRFRY